MIIEKLTAVLGWQVDSKELSKFNQQAQGVADWGKKLAFAATAAATALTAVGVAAANALSRTDRLAKSLGITTRTFMALGDALKHAGIDGNKVIRMIESMQSRLGRRGPQAKIARDAVKRLNIEYAELAKLNPEQQFITILDAAKASEDAQLGSAAAAEILGTQAIRMVGLLRTFDGTVQEIIDSHNELNFVSDQGIEGATMLTMAMDNITNSAGSMVSEISGLAGGVVAPYVDLLGQWIAANKELIQQRMDEIVRDIADAMRWLAWAGSKISGVIKELGGFARILKVATLGIVSLKAAGLITAFAALIPTIATAGKGIVLFKLALTGLTRSIPFLAVTAFALAMEDIYATLSGKKSLGMALVEKHLPAVEMSILRAVGAIWDLTEAEKEQIRVAEHLADNVDVQKYFEDMVKAETRQRILHMVEDFKTAMAFLAEEGAKSWQMLGDALTVFGEKLVALVKIGDWAWATLGKAISDFTKASDTAILDFVNSVVGYFDSFIDSAQALFQKIPLLGKLFKDAPSVNINTSQSSPLSRAVSQNSQVNNRSDVKVDAPINIRVNNTSAASAGSIAKEVSTQIATQVRQAVQANDTGIRR